MKPRPRLPRAKADAESAGLWQMVHIEWAEGGWGRLHAVMEREPRLALVATAVLIAAPSAVGMFAIASLPSAGRVAAAVLLLPVLFVATGWAVLPWLASTDRRRALLPVGVMVVGVAVCCAGGWWLLPGVVTLLVAAGLGIRELRLIGRDVELERLKE